MRIPPVSILIADDHAMVRAGLRTVLESSPGWTVCAEAADGRAAVRLARELTPRVAIVDFSMPELNGLEAARQMRGAAPGTAVILLTMQDSEELVGQAVAAGVRGYVLKSDAGDQIVRAVGAVLENRAYFAGPVARLLLNNFNQPARSPGAADTHAPLTPREREIIQLIAEGRSTKEVATALGIAPKTAEAHRGNLMRKLNFHSVSEMVRYAVRQNIIQS